MTTNGQRRETVRADSLDVGDLIDGTQVLLTLAADGFDADPRDWADAEWRLWDVEGTTHHGDGSVTVITGRHGVWNLAGGQMVIRQGTLVKGRA